MKKNGTVRDRILILSVILVIAAIVCIAAYLILSSRHIRECENRLHTLGSGSHVITGEYDGTRVVVAEDNRPQLMSVLGSANVWDYNGQETEESAVQFTFDGDKMWYLIIYRIDDEYVKMVIDGEEQYEFLSDNNGKFDKYVKLASAEGWNVENRVIGE